MKRIPAASLLIDRFPKISEKADLSEDLRKIHREVWLTAALPVYYEVYERLKTDSRKASPSPL